MGSCTGTRKISRRFSVPDQAQQSITAFSRSERTLLQMIFKDLSSRSENDEISLKTFQTFFHLNAVRSHCLFKKFAKNNRQSLNLEDFLAGVASAFCSINQVQKQQFLFDLYDVDSSNGISYSQLIAILLSYPRDQLVKIIKNQSFVETLSSQKLLYFFTPDMKLGMDEDDETDCTFPTLNRHYSYEIPQIMPETLKLSPRKSETNDISKLTFGRKFYLTSIIRQYASYLFRRFRLDKDHEQLCITKFSQLVADHPRIYDAYYEGFHEFLWRFDPNTGQPCYKNGKVWREANCLQVYKCKRQKRFIRYINTAILVFESGNPSQIPIEIKNLEGLEIKATQSKQYGYGFKICHEETHYPQKAYFFETKEEQCQWLKLTKQFQQMANNIFYKYRIQRVIGQGSYSHVHQCQSISTGQKYSVKIIEKGILSKQEQQTIESEWDILNLCEHPNILVGYKKFQTKTNIYLVTELLEEGTLFEYVKNKQKLSEYEACHIMKQLLSAVRYMHSMGLIHRDLKLDNILVKSKEEGITPKIIDFGLAVHKINLKNLDKHQKFSGTPGFVAPELYYHREYDETVDLFSLGVIMYFLLCGRLPFHSIDPLEVRELTCRCEVPLDSKIWKERSPESKDLLLKMLTYKSNRIGSAAAYHHQWICRLEEWPKECSQC